MSRHRGEPLYRQLATTIGARIEAGELAPDEQLSSEGDLAAEFGVNRLTVRQALADLVREGLIRTIHGRGSFVARPAVRYPVSASQAASLTRAMRRQGIEVVQQPLRTSTGASPEVRRALEGRGRILCLQLVRLVDSAPWSLSSMWVVEARFCGLADAWRSGSSLYDVFEDRYGVRMRRRARSFAALPATAADAEHLLVPVGSPILVTRGLNVDVHDRPVAFVEHRFRGDRVQYEVDLP